MAKLQDHLSLRMPAADSSSLNNRKNTGRSALNAMSHELTLKEKLKEAYHKPSHFMKSFPSRAGASYFWFIAVSELYVLVQFAVPHVFRDYSDMSVYYLKLMSWIIFIETIANWLCTRFFDTALHPSLDNPIGNHGNKNGAHSNHPGGSEKNDQLTSGFCTKCNLVKPYRTHHCKLCDNCILKRDHHCYFTGTCIGYFNQRFFIILNFYIILASAWGLYVILEYMRTEFQPRSNWDYVLPVTTFNYWTRNYIPLHQLLMMFQLWTLWWTGLAALGFVLWHIFWVVPRGLTTHEVTTYQEYTVRCTSSISENFRSVFGVFWLLNFILPAVILYKQEGDGKTWNNLKFIKYVSRKHKVTP